MSGILLFSGSDLAAILDNQKEKIEKMVLGISSQRLVKTDVEKLTLELTKKLRVAPVLLLENDISVEQKETKIDVSQNPYHFVRERGKPFLVSGIKVTYYVPFTGSVEFLKSKPNRFNYNPPQATKIVKNELIFEYDRTDGDVKHTKKDFDITFNDLKQWVRYVNDQIEQYNQSLTEPIRSKISARKQILITSQQQINEIGFKVRLKNVPVPKIKTQTSKAVKGKVVKPKTTSVKKLTEESLEFDVALSFAGEDRTYVDKVAQILRRKKIKVFYDNFNKVQLWGNNLIDHLGEVYAQRSRFIVMFISKYYAEKEWTNHERQFAQQRAFKLKKNCILPVRFDNTTILGLPSTLGYIDLQKTPVHKRQTSADKSPLGRIG